MLISDLLGQYHSATSPTGLTGTKGVQKLVSSLRDMGAGNIFEGTVNSIKGGRVTLGLPNGQEITARMDGKVPLSVGQSMFFQVKSNDGAQIAIRPFTVDGNSVNLTLLEALKAAGINVDGRNLSMVNTMMEEQMSIDRGSLTQMARVLAGNPDIDVKTLVQMQKLELPISPEMASQFQNYADDKQAITQNLNTFMDKLPGVLAQANLSGETLQKMGLEILTALTEHTAGDGGMMTPGGESVTTAQTGQSEAPGVLTEGAPGAPNAPETEGLAKVLQNAPEAGVKILQNAPASQVIVGAGDLAVSGDGQQVSENAVPAANVQTADDHAVITQELSSKTRGMPAEGVSNVPVTEDLSATFSNAQASSVAAFVEELQAMPQFAGVSYTQGQSASGVLEQLTKLLAAQSAPDTQELLALFENKGFQGLMKTAMEEQWLIKPEELSGSGNRINRLYDRLENQLEKLEHIVRASGADAESADAKNVTLLAADIRSNIEFMNQINQAYTYVQIPLKLSGQNASGELYVYTNRRGGAQEKEELTAFLHLDMDALGPTDVSVRLKGRDVSTNFYFDTDASYELVMAHVGELEERLRSKGYNCRTSVTNEAHKVNFVEDFLKKDQPSAGLVHRYSFDMRA